MNPGRELDAEIAEKVMGARWAQVYSGGVLVRYLADGSNSGDGWASTAPMDLPIDPVMHSVRPYSTDIAAAMTVADKFRGYRLNKNREADHAYEGTAKRATQIYTCTLYNGAVRAFLGVSSLGKYGTSRNIVGGSNESLSHAICLAALKAVGFNS